MTFAAGGGLLACGGAGQVSLFQGDGGAPGRDGAGLDVVRDVGGEGTGPDAPPDVLGAPCSTTCVPAVPGGWSGPEELYEGSAVAPSCGSPFGSSPAYHGNLAATGAPATCSTCSCSTPTDVVCSPSVSATLYKDSACSKPCGTTPVTLPAGACTSVAGDLIACGGAVTNAHISITGAKAIGGTCTPSKGSASVPPAGWEGNAQSCTPATAPSSAGCGGGGLCVPPLDPSYVRYCIRQSGDQPCPSSGYTERQVFYGAMTDTRGCTACTCGDVTPDACATSGVGAYETSCSVFTSADYTPLPTACAPLGITTQNLSYYALAKGGACVSGGGQPMGMVEPAEPTTFCCAP